MCVFYGMSMTLTQVFQVMQVYIFKSPNYFEITPPMNPANFAVLVVFTCFCIYDLKSFLLVGNFHVHKHTAVPCTVVCLPISMHTRVFPLLQTRDQTL